MREAIEREFENDPIYRMCLIHEITEDELFPEPILSMHHETSYSTVDTGKILGRPDSTIRNHFRTDLLEYVAPERFGKYYRMDWKCVFRLHMIFWLMERRGKSTVDILVELGTEPAVAVTNFNARKGVIHKSLPSNEVGPSDELLKKVDMLTKMVEQVVSSGLFEIQQNEAGEKRIALKEEYASSKFKLLADNNDKIEQVIKDNEQLKRENRDIVAAIKEDRLKSKIKEDLQREALSKWNAENKRGIIEKIFGNQDEYDNKKINYTNKYVEEHINERLNQLKDEKGKTSILD